MNELDRKERAVLEKAFEIVEISKRRDEMLAEFAQLLGKGTAKSVVKKTAVSEKTKTNGAGSVKKSAVRYPNKPGRPPKADRILGFMKKSSKKIYTVHEIAVGIKEPGNNPSVAATLKVMADNGRVAHVGTNAYSLVKSAVRS